MTEKQDEIRLKELLGVFCTETYKELIGILKRDQDRYHQEQLKLLDIDNVSIMLRCLDDSIGNITIDNVYTLLVESKRHYNIIDDNGNDVLMHKSYFDKLN